MNTANPAPPLLTTLQWQLADSRINSLQKKKNFFLKKKKSGKAVNQKICFLIPSPLKLTLAYRAVDSHGKKMPALSTIFCSRRRRQWFSSIVAS